MSEFDEFDAFEAAARPSLSARALAARPVPYLDGLNAAQRQAVETLDGPVLMLAGAGTGKTRALTTRIAHLLTQGRARPNEILAVTFTNKAAREMKSRIGALLGETVEGMPWLGTFHAICVKLLRRHAELVGLKSNFTILDTDDQVRLMKQLILAAGIAEKRWPARTLAHLIDGWKNRALTPEKVPVADASDFNSRGTELYAQYQTRLTELNACDFGDLLLHMVTIFQHHPDVLAQYQRWFRYVLVDEYQDTNVAQYLWLRLLAGGHRNICCVGDDDQSIYGWRGAEVGNILRFEKDFPGAQVIRLEQNYRSTGHIIAASNTVIAGASDRMKLGHDITIDRNRRKEPLGGVMAEGDPVGQGRVQLLQCPPGDRAQAVAAVTELQRLAALEPGWNWSRTAIIARNWRQLAPVRAYAEAQGIPVEMANESMPSLWRLREMRQFIDGISGDRTRLLDVTDLLECVNTLPRNRWSDLIAEGVAALVQEIGTGSASVPDLVEWFGEWARDARGEQHGLLLMTAHRAKGLEFDDVVILNGGWDRPSRNEDLDAPRRLFYVAMTRARRTLAVMTQGAHAFLPSLGDSILRRHAALPDVKDLPPDRAYLMPDMSQVFIDWAGRLRAGDVSLEAIAQARTGDPVTLKQQNGRWWVTDRQGRRLIGMKGGWAVPDGRRIVSAAIGAIVARHAHESGEDHRGKLQQDSWEVVLPEIILE